MKSHDKNPFEGECRCRRTHLLTDTFRNSLVMRYSIFLNVLKKIIALMHVPSFYLIYGYNLCDVAVVRCSYATSQVCQFR